MAERDMPHRVLKRLFLLGSKFIDMSIYIVDSAVFCNQFSCSYLSHAFDSRHIV